MEAPVAQGLGSFRLIPAHSRPTGLIVSALALQRAGAILDRRDAGGQALRRACVHVRAFPGEPAPAPFLTDHD